MASRILNTLDTFAVNVDGELETENISELYKPCPFLVAMSRLQTVPLSKIILQVVICSLVYILCFSSVVCIAYS